MPLDHMQIINTISDFILMQSTYLQVVDKSKLGKGVLTNVGIFSKPQD